ALLLFVGQTGRLRAATQRERAAAARHVNLDVVAVEDAQRVFDAPANLHIEELVDHAEEIRRRLAHADIAIVGHAAAGVVPAQAEKLHGASAAVLGRSFAARVLIGP